MTKRKALSQKTRFEVFKRDKFTCQYCGAKAPDVVLEADHIHPVAEGGADEILNLVTACAGCNGGKGARCLDDMSVVERQRLQIEELEERRQQLEMMLQWRDGLRSIDDDTVKMIAEAIGSKSQWVPNENGERHIRRWSKRYGVDDLLMAIDEAFDAYFKANEKDDWEKAFNKIERFAQLRVAAQSDPFIKDIVYIQGVLRRRLRHRRLDCIEAVREMMEGGLSGHAGIQIAKGVGDWDEFCTKVNAELARIGAEDD